MKTLLFTWKSISTDGPPDVTLSSPIKRDIELLDLLWRLSSENGQKTFVLLGRRSLSSDVVPLRRVEHLELVEVADKP